VDKQQLEGSEATGGAVKTCPACGGTWPADRRHCLACGASLAEVPSRAADEAAGPQEINWAVLDAMSPEEGGSRAETRTAPPAKEPDQGEGSALARLLRRLGLGGQ
jgi:hypothetical protein